MSTSIPGPMEVSKEYNEKETPDIYHVPRSFQVPEDTDATKSTTEKLQQITLFTKFLERKVYLVMGLSPKLRLEFVKFLKANIDYFVLSHLDMIGIPLEVVVHKICFDPNFPPIKKKKRSISEVRNKLGKEEVTRLHNIGSIHKINYHDWLYNVLVVPSKNNKFRMCIDFKDLNKACLKDSFPLPIIYQMIDSTVGHELMIFLDAYFRYNQIWMNLED